MATKHLFSNNERQQAPAAFKAACHTTNIALGFTITLKVGARYFMTTPKPQLARMILERARAAKVTFSLDNWGFGSKRLREFD